MCTYILRSQQLKKKNKTRKQREQPSTSNIRRPVARRCCCRFVAVVVVVFVVVVVVVGVVWSCRSSHVVELEQPVLLAARAEDVGHPELRVGGVELELRQQAVPLVEQ